MKIEKYHNYLFLILLITLYYILDFQTILFLPPQGIHFIRQTDCLSFASNYFKNGFHFFQPQVFNLQSTDGKAACEFPILYYIAASLYQIFGEKEYILRLITVIISSAGFYYLFKLLNTLLKDLVYAIAFSFLFISSTVLLYYTNNFLPDSSALGLTFIGWYFMFDFINNREKRNSLIVGYVFFTIASLLKVTYFTNPIAAILSIVAYDLSFDRAFKKIIRANATPIILFFSSFVIILCWNLYVIQYNDRNHDTYFLIHSTPIWRLSIVQITQVWDLITNYWYSKYYYQSTFHLFFIIIVTGALFFKRMERILLITSTLSLIGATLYFLLFFAQFSDHDYYFIAIIPAIIFLVTSTFISLRNRFTRLINNYITKLLVITICILSLNYAREKLIQRYANANDIYSSIGFKLTGMRVYLDSLEVPQNAKFVILTDQTMNGGLYFINRPGWVVKDESEVSLKVIEKYINQDLDFMIVTDSITLNPKFKCKKIGEKNGNLIYKFENTSNN